MDKWDIPAELPKFAPGETVAQLQGLAIELGYSCPQCHFLTTNRRIFTNHMLKEHQSRVGHERCMCPVQRLNSNTIPFPIQPVATTSPSTSLSDFVDELMSKVDAAYKTPVAQYTTDNRLITPFLLVTKWPKIVQGYPVPKLIALCASPTASDGYLTRASYIVKKMTSMAIDTISLLPELILQHLNTPDPVKGCVFLCFKKVL